MFEFVDNRMYLNSEDARAFEEGRWPEYVHRWYAVIARLHLPREFGGITRAEAARMMKISKRQVYRRLRRYREEGVAGLKDRPRRPRSIPNLSPEWLERLVVEVQARTGFRHRNVAVVVNRALADAGVEMELHYMRVYWILRRYRERTGIWAKEDVKDEGSGLEGKEGPRFFDWQRPNNLIQTDLTLFNRVPLLTMLDDHTRMVWACPLKGHTTEEVTRKMAAIGPRRYENALTDNGTQFRACRTEWNDYLRAHVRKNHIRSSLRHPETLGKVSAYQRDLKEFLKYHMGRSRNRKRMARFIGLYNLFVNNAKPHSTTGEVPEQAYSGRRRHNWFGRFVKAFGLENAVRVPPTSVSGGNDPSF